MPHPYYGVVIFDTNKVAERDQMPAKSSKEAEDLLAYWMSKIKYRLVKLSWFPEECKITKLKWLHKKGSRDRSLELQTYFCFAFSIQIFWEIKIFSVKRLKKNGLLYIYRRRSRAIFSVHLCRAQLPDFVFPGKDKGMHTIMVLIELQKALDTLNHEFLNHKTTKPRIWHVLVLKP